MCQQFVAVTYVLVATHNTHTHALFIAIFSSKSRLASSAPIFSLRWSLFLAFSDSAIAIRIHSDFRQALKQLAEGPAVQDERIG